MEVIALLIPIVGIVMFFATVMVFLTYRHKEKMARMMQEYNQSSKNADAIDLRKRESFSETGSRNN